MTLRDSALLPMERRCVVTREVDQPDETSRRPGRRLGLDVGTVRIGAAVSDSNARLATPVETVARVTPLAELRARDLDGADLRRVAELCREYQVVEIVIGLPRNLSGRGSASVDQATAFGDALARLIPGTPIRYCDERLTTVVASQAMRASGLSTRHSRSVIDQAAAVEILQSWLDQRRAFLEREAAPAASTIAPRSQIPTPGDLARARRRTPAESSVSSTNDPVAPDNEE